jgi:4-amino-4-deoxy-L-arabinose transferase-like glycosyltransferase
MIATTPAPLRLATARPLAKRAPFRLFHPFLFLVVFVCILFFARLGHRDLYSSHEARAAQNAQRMLDTGAWGLPVLFDGRVDLQKPPLYYWMVAAVGWLNGGAVTEWVVRFPAALAGLVCVVLVYAFLRADSRPTAAIIAALVLATANHFTGISRTARIDVPLTCAVTVALMAFYRGCCVHRMRPEARGQKTENRGQRTEDREQKTENRGQRTEDREQTNSGLSSVLCPLSSTASTFGATLAWHLLAAVAAAVAVLLKGPVGLALIGPAAVVWLVVERRYTGARLPVVSLLLGPLVVAAVALPWFIWANVATDGEFFRVFFWHHTIARFTGSSPQLATYPAWYYLPRFIVDFLPWTPLLNFLAIWGFRSGLWRRDSVFRFGLITFVTMFVVMSTAKFKRADYLLPLFPFAALAVGSTAEAWLQARRRPLTERIAKWSFYVIIAAVSVGWVVMTAVVEPGEQAKEEKRRFAEVIRSHAPAPQMILQFRMESHLLSYHLGRPVHTFVEWGELNELLAAPGPHFVVMPPEYVYPAGEIVKSRKLVIIARLEEYTAGKPLRPLVFLRTSD